MTEPGKPGTLALVLGTAGGLAGNYVHGGFGVRVAF